MKFERLTNTTSARRLGGVHQAGRGRTGVEEGIRALRPSDGARACLLPVLACAPALRKYLKSASTSVEFKMRLIIRASSRISSARRPANAITRTREDRGQRFIKRINPIH